MIALTNDTDSTIINIAAFADQPFDNNIEIDLAQLGLAQVTLVPASGVVISSKGGATKLTGQFSFATLKVINTDSWFLFGDIAT